MNAISKVEAMRQASKAKAEENRKAMPTISGVVDQIREFFGPDCKVTFAIENGRVLGVEDRDVGMPLTKIELVKPAATVQGLERKKCR